MLNTSQAYRAAVVADARQMVPRLVVDIVDPDIVYGSIVGSELTLYSVPAQLHDGVFQPGTPYATCERGRWLLNGTFDVAPSADTQVGAETRGLFAADGGGNYTVELDFSGVSILQACTIYFAKTVYNGWPYDFTVDILSGGTSVYSENFTANDAGNVTLTGFTVHNPDGIAVTVTAWSQPGRRCRLTEIIAGTHEVWSGDELAGLDVQQQGAWNGLSMPYNTASVTLDNQDRRFEPRSPSGLFKSIEERQGMSLSIGAVLPGSQIEYAPGGVFYQAANGWRTGDNGITIKWELVDIIGLLVDRSFVVPSPLPTDVEGWIAALVAQLGINFTGRYTVDPTIASENCTAAASALAGVTCGQVLSWICMAAGAWARAASETGRLTVEQLKNGGDNVTLDNLASYPVIAANDDVAFVSITTSANITYTYAGTSTAAGRTVNVKNPFLHTQAQADAAARLILSTFGGNRIEITGRGNPSSEIGDVDTVQLDESTATAARRITQAFSFSDGVLKNCKSTLLQADGSFLWTQREIFTADTIWLCPAGVTSARLILVGKGSNGGTGARGTYNGPGADGSPGLGGLVWVGTIGLNPGQSYIITIGAASTFGAYSSTDGIVYPYGLTDLATGDVFARSGVAQPVAGTGDGGAGGDGGRRGIRDENGNIVVRPRDGSTGVAGATGAAIIYYELS